MNREIEILKRIHDLSAPRNLNPLPAWADPHILESLIASGYLTYYDVARDEEDIIFVVLRAELTESGRKLLDSKLRPDWAKLTAIAVVLTFILAAIRAIINYVAGKP